MSKHVARTITEQWIQDIRAALRARDGYGQVELAADCGCSQAAISKVLRSPGKVSKFVVPMSEVLGIDLPPLAPISGMAQQVIDVLDELDEDGRAALFAHARLLLKISRK